MTAKILIIDDDPKISKSIKMLLEDYNYQIVIENSPLKAILAIANEQPDLVLLDVRMPEVNGLELFESIKKLKIPVIFVSGEATVEEAVQAVKMGGSDFIVKPVQPERLLISIEKALEYNVLKTEFNSLQKEFQKKYEMIGNTEYYSRLFDSISKIAPTQGRVLITGESGTGKELVARAIHDLSKLSGKFVKINAAAISPNLFESEIFGHEKGAFTGADRLRIGLYEEANGGTLFLDEIAELDMNLQAKLLRVLQNNEITRVGSNRPIAVNARVISATNKNLSEMVKRGTFREDLYYRLNVIPIELPPLRERKSDIPVLVHSFIDKCCRENGVNSKIIKEEALKSLVNYNWPGNVRELKNIVERIVILSNNVIEASDVPSDIKKNENDLTTFSEITLREFKERHEKDYIIELLKRHSGNISKVAKILDLERTYLHKKLVDYKINKKSYFLDTDKE